MYSRSFPVSRLFRRLPSRTSELTKTSVLDGSTPSCPILKPLLDPQSGWSLLKIAYLFWEVLCIMHCRLSLCEDRWKVLLRLKSLLLLAALILDVSRPAWDLANHYSVEPYLLKYRANAAVPMFLPYGVGTFTKLVQAMMSLGTLQRKCSGELGGIAGWKKKWSCSHITACKLCSACSHPYSCHAAAQENSSTSNFMSASSDVVVPLLRAT